MRSSYVILFAIFVLAGSGFWLLHSDPRPVLDRDPTQNGASALEETDSLKIAAAAVDKSSLETAALGPASSAAAAGIAASLKGEPERPYLNAPPLSGREQRSMRTMFGTFFKFARGKTALNRLLKELEENGLEPVVAKDFNDQTGKMITIRTNEALDGTRYFHAQYFEDDNKEHEPFRQHASFETRPSPDCMKVAKEIVETQLGKTLGVPTAERGDDWVEWKKDHSSIWIQRLSAQDLSHDRFNARTIADVGACRAAIELIPDEDHSATD